MSYLLLCLVYFGPLVLLLTERAKRNRLVPGVIFPPGPGRHVDRALVAGGPDLRSASSGSG